MYGNTDLLKAPTLKLGWVFELLGLSTDGATNTEEMYNKLVLQAASIDPLGQHGFIVKVLHVNVMLMFIMFVLVLVGILLSAVWVGVLLPLLRNTLGKILVAFGVEFVRSSGSVGAGARVSVGDDGMPSNRRLCLVVSRLLPLFRILRNLRVEADRPRWRPISLSPIFRQVIRPPSRQRKRQHRQHRQ